MKINISHITLPEDFDKVTDLYIPEENPMFGIIYPKSIELRRCPEYGDIVSLLLEESKKKNKLDFSLELNHEKKRILFRGHYIDSIEGRVYIFRRLPSHVPNIEDLGMAPNILELLISDRLNTGGLVIIAGETGQGKSTTAAALISYRLQKHASFCLTLEDPVEMPLQGFYNTGKEQKGVCFQTPVEEDGFPEAIKGAMRCYPSKSNSILFLGETRDPFMASEVIKIAANGHLVVTTMHGSDLISSLKRFISLAISAQTTSEQDIKSMFAMVFRLMIHQKIDVLGNGTKKLRPQILFSPSQSSSVANRMKSSIEMLSTEIQAQNSAIMKGKSLLDELY
jgi:Tfp pilus assembly pilus retraction ATPase PilT